MLTKIDRLAVDPARSPAAAVVVRRDTPIGQTLVLLIRSTKYCVRFVTLPSFSARRSLDGAQQLLLAPGFEFGDQKTILSSVGFASDDPDLSVVELVSAAQATRVGTRHFVVPWPCLVKALKERIRTVLSLDATREKSGCVPSRTSKDRMS